MARQIYLTCAGHIDIIVKDLTCIPFGVGVFPLDTCIAPLK